MENFNKTQIQEALKILRETLQILVEAAECNSKFCENLCDDYPFEHSLDEVSAQVDTFVETQLENLKENSIKMKFHEFITKEIIEKEEEYDAIIGNVEMSHTLGACTHWKLTDYCWQQYADLLNADCYIIPANDDYSTPVVFCEEASEVLGEHFCAALAGYVGVKEFDMLFGTHDAELTF